MAKASDRRGFFGELLRSGVEIAREVNSAIRLDAETDPFEPDPWTDPRPVPAKPTSYPASAGDLAALCREVGLPDGRLVDVERLANPSLRLTRAELRAPGPGASRLGGVPDLPPAFDWPRWGERSLDFVGQVDLAEVAVLVPEVALPPTGLLSFFYDAEQEPSGLAPAHRGSCRVVLERETGSLRPDPEGRARFADYPLVLSRELTLPPAHSFRLEPLALDDAEFDAWIRLRERLAEVQGVVLEDHSPDWYALHRLFGHPDPFAAGEVELDCQLVTHGLDLSESEGYFDPRREELEAGAADWRLLLQVSADDALGANWGDRFGRLYFWIREADLRAGSFDDVWAILQ